MNTERTIEEARAYIEESIITWNIDGEHQKIVSLANLAERWRRKPVITPALKMKELNKNIKALNLVIKRSLKVDEEANVKELETILNTTKKEYAELSAKLGGATITPVRKRQNP